MNCEYYVLFNSDGFVRAADASGFVGTTFPWSLAIGNDVYAMVCDEDTFFFWDEFIDEAGRTTGFQFFLPDGPALGRSRLVRDSKNVCLVDEVEVNIDLCKGAPHRWDCVQGFSSEVYQSLGDPLNCAILMFNWTRRCPAIPIVQGDVRVSSSLFLTGADSVQ